jgi:PAS domain S-box-containing protein
MTDATNTALLHELKVHQVELEMQNEELRRAQVELAAARDRYMDLYDFAPVGYFTLDERGVILEANLTASVMVEQERKTLLGRNFAQFLAICSDLAWQAHLKSAFEQAQSLRLELGIKRRDGTQFDGQLDCLPIASAGKSATLRVALTDISERKLAEASQRTADALIEASETERRQVSRELHEELGQRLSALKMELASLAQAAQDPAQHGQRLAGIQSSLADSVSIVRRIASGLRPLMLDDLGLNAAIDWLARESAKRLNVEVLTHLDTEDPPVNERATIAIYRMVNDMLNQLACNGDVKRIDIALQRSSTNLELSVQGSSNWPSPPTGLIERNDMTQSLTERTRMLEGRLQLEQTRSGGLRFTVSLPLQALQQNRHPSPTEAPHATRRL